MGSSCSLLEVGQVEGQREGVGAEFAVSWRCQLVWGSLMDNLEEQKQLCLLGAPLLCSWRWQSTQRWQIILQRLGSGKLDTGHCGRDGCGRRKQGNNEVWGSVGQDVRRWDGIGKGWGKVGYYGMRQDRIEMKNGGTGQMGLEGMEESETQWEKMGWTWDEERWGRTDGMGLGMDEGR